MLASAPYSVILEINEYAWQLQQSFIWYIFLFRQITIQRYKVKFSDYYSLVHITILQQFPLYHLPWLA